MVRLRYAVQPLRVTIASTLLRMLTRSNRSFRQSPANMLLLDELLPSDSLVLLECEELVVRSGVGTEGSLFVARYAYNSVG